MGFSYCGGKQVDPLLSDGLLNNMTKTFYPEKRAIFLDAQKSKTENENLPSAKGDFNLHYQLLSLLDSN